MRRVSLTINGKAVTHEVEPRTHLADFVREELMLTGTHIGCEHGICGACTVMIDGAPARACLTYAALCDGADVRTVESFVEDPLMERLRDAFKRHHALQCGYCTPGMLATGYDIARRLPGADEHRIREELSGNLCRCTGYVGIVAAIGEVARGTADKVSGVIADEAAVPLSASAVMAPALAPRVREIGMLRGPLPKASAASPEPAALLETPAGDGFRRRVIVPVSPERLWSILRDVPTTARCLPGASLEQLDDDGRIAGRVNVAVGPMRASFAGEGTVKFDHVSRSGNVAGKGVDAATRSRAEGAISFNVEEAPEGRAVLAVAIEYDLKGPLAQMGRSAIVADIVNRLLEMFAGNLVKAARGEEVAEAEPLGGIGMVLSALAARLRRLFANSGSSETKLG